MGPYAVVMYTCFQRCSLSHLLSPPTPPWEKNSEAEISMQEFIREHYLCRTGKQIGAEGVQLQFTCIRGSADPARCYGAAMALQSQPPFVRSLSGQNQCVTETCSSIIRIVGGQRSHSFAGTCRTNHLAVQTVLGCECAGTWRTAHSSGLGVQCNEDSCSCKLLQKQFQTSVQHFVA